MNTNKIRGFEPVSEEGLALVPKMIEGFVKKGFPREKIFVNKEYIEPKRATYDSAGSDIFYTGDEDIVIAPGDKAFIITNVKAYMQKHETLLGDVRSSQGIFKDVMLANTVAIIDKDYYNNKGNEGNIGVGLRNLGNTPLIIKKGEAISQLMFTPYLPPDNAPEEVERVGGYGSTK